MFASHAGSVTTVLPVPLLSFSKHFLCPINLFLPARAPLFIILFLPLPSPEHYTPCWGSFRDRLLARLSSAASYSDPRGRSRGFSRLPPQGAKYDALWKVWPRPRSFESFFSRVACLSHNLGRNSGMPTIFTIFFGFGVLTNSRWLPLWAMRMYYAFFVKVSEWSAVLGSWLKHVGIRKHSKRYPCIYMFNVELSLSCFDVSLYMYCQRKIQDAVMFDCIFRKDLSSSVIQCEYSSQYTVYDCTYNNWHTWRCSFFKFVLLWIFSIIKFKSKYYDTWRNEFLNCSSPGQSTLN